jgi:hypothetical protein
MNTLGWSEVVELIFNLYFGPDAITELLQNGDKVQSRDAKPISAGERCSTAAPLGEIQEAHPLTDELLPPRHDMGADNVSIHSQPAPTSCGLNVVDVLRVGPPAVGIGEIGESFALWRNLRRGLTPMGSDGGMCGETTDRAYWDRH